MYHEFYFKTSSLQTNHRLNTDHPEAWRIYDGTFNPPEEGIWVTDKTLRKSSLVIVWDCDEGSLETKMDYKLILPKLLNFFHNILL